LKIDKQRLWYFVIVSILIFIGDHFIVNPDKTLTASIYTGILGGVIATGLYWMMKKWLPHPQNTEKEE